MTVTIFKVWWRFRDRKGICAGSLFKPTSFEGKEANDNSILESYWFYVFEGNMSDDYNRARSMTNLENLPDESLNELLFERLEIYRDGRLIGVDCDSVLLPNNHDINKVLELYKDIEVVYLDSYIEVISGNVSESG